MVLVTPTKADSVSRKALTLLVAKPNKGAVKVFVKELPQAPN